MWITCISKHVYYLQPTRNGCKTGVQLFIAVVSTAYDWCVTDVEHIPGAERVSGGFVTKACPNV